MKSHRAVESKDVQSTQNAKYALEIQSHLNLLQETHNQVYESVGSFYNVFLGVSFLIIIVPLYVFVHSSLKDNGSASTYTSMIGVIGLMLVGSFAVKYF